ncbi:NUDIX domain-containing protein [Leifsonia shinshuensis]|uniref:NUDIX domain-containing protein n=1 Tax=Leifsonia shinshuensis TaxID=150026 RepID=UPI001F508C04|nr:NUDIX domain-containing protein [Leifsonia shinshuensis]MCI0155726.1 NUDIX domain-containing protein [Leifsonia shinshuensis]
MRTFLLARHAITELWSLIGGGIEPGEDPADALRREVLEETGAEIRIVRLVSAYGGDELTGEYPNGDRVGYVTIAYECELLGPATPDMVELVELGWFDREAIPALARREWIDRVVADAE